MQNAKPLVTGILAQGKHFVLLELRLALGYSVMHGSEL